MWHQACLLFKARFPELACPPELLERSRAAHRKGALRGRPPTLLQRALKQEVERQAPGQRVVSEYAVEAPDGEGWLLVDVALPELRIALEADGPYHFLRNVPQQLRGETAARNRLLRAWHWEVVSMSHTAWEDASGFASVTQE